MTSTSAPSCATSPAPGGSASTSSTPTPPACWTLLRSARSGTSSPSGRPGPAARSGCSRRSRSTGPRRASPTATTPSASARGSWSPARAARSASSSPAGRSTSTAPRRSSRRPSRPGCSCPAGAGWASATAASCRCGRAPSVTCATARAPRPLPGTASSSRPASAPPPAPATSTTEPAAPEKEPHMTALQKKPVNPVAHLSAEDIESIGKELDAIRQEVMDSRGDADAAYIRRVIDVQRKLELGSRAVLLFSKFPPAWVLGTVGLSVAKILENMEIGHNILHGQWGWMRDPKIHSTTWEWDMASPAAQWKHSHNELHHTYTNVIGKDNDLGYGIMRDDEDQKWHPLYLAQPLWNFINACFFEYGIAAYDLELGKNLATKKRRANPKFRARAKVTLKKIRNQITKDY